MGSFWKSKYRTTPKLNSSVDSCGGQTAEGDVATSCPHLDKWNVRAGCKQTKCSRLASKLSCYLLFSSLLRLRPSENKKHSLNMEDDWKHSSSTLFNVAASIIIIYWLLLNLKLWQWSNTVILSQHFLHILLSFSVQVNLEARRIRERCCYTVYIEH